ncbi:MAG: hypothetical protein ACM336_21810 [Acidobacteriota bacterium]
MFRDLHGCTGFEENAVGYFARTAKALSVSKAVVATKSADSPAFARDKSERGMSRDGVPQRLQFPVDGVLAGWKNAE